MVEQFSLNQMKRHPAKHLDETQKHQDELAVLSFAKELSPKLVTMFKAYSKNFLAESEREFLQTLEEQDIPKEL